MHECSLRVSCSVIVPVVFETFCSGFDVNVAVLIVVIAFVGLSGRRFVFIM